MDELLQIKVCDSDEQSLSKTSIHLVNASQFISAEPIYACQFDGKGNGVLLDFNDQVPLSQPCWIHLDSSNLNTIAWIKQTTLLPELVKEELIKPKQIAKELRFDSGIFVVLKGVNITASTLPDPITTFCFYITDNLIISVRNQRIDAIARLKEYLNKGVGPVDVADWLIQISDLICDQINQSFETVHTKIVKLEDRVLNQQTLSNKDIGRVRRQLIILRRLLAPQRDIFVRIASERISWIDSNDRQHLHDISSQQNHYINDIDSCLLRLSSLMEQINGYLAESTNKRIYLMTLFTLIFMPITFLTSLLGVNLGGIPFNEDKWGFAILVIIIIVMSVAFIAWLKYKKWM